MLQAIPGLTALLLQPQPELTPWVLLAGLVVLLLIRRWSRTGDWDQPWIAHC